jgi:hypothetical protein
MNKPHGHYCRICHSLRSNEAFSGKGHRNHICKKCACLPKEQREQIGCEEEIFNFLQQSHISENNISRLRILAASPYERISGLAQIVLEVAQFKPYKKRRLKELAQKRRDLLQKLQDSGLILAYEVEMNEDQETWL